MTSLIARSTMRFGLGAAALLCAAGFATTAARAAPGDAIIIVANKTYDNRAPAVEFADRDADEIEKAARAPRLLNIGEIGIKRFNDMTRGQAEDWFKRDGTPGADLVAHIKRAAGSRRDATIYFYYTGHGVNARNDVRQQDELHLVLRDTTTSGLGSTGLSMEAIKMALNAVQKEHVPDGRVVLLVDACFSGVDRNNRPLWPEARLLPPSSKVRETTPEKMVMLSASAASEPAWSDAARKHGAFTDAVLDGLYGMAADRNGRVTGRALLDFVSKRVNQRLAYHGRSQTPTIDGDGNLQVASLQLPFKPRDEALLRTTERMCKVLVVSEDATEIADFLKGTCLADCPCREQLEQKLDTIAGAQRACDEDMTLLNKLIPRGAAAKRQLEVLRDETPCASVKSKAVAALDSFNPPKPQPRPDPAPPSYNLTPKPNYVPVQPPVQQWTPPSPEPTPTFGIRRFDRHWVEGDGYVKIMGGSRESCEQACLADSSCQMMEYYFGREDGGRKCNLFAHQRRRSGSNEAHVGVKVRQ